MARLVGLYAGEDAASASEHWQELIAGEGEPLARGQSGPLRVSIFADHVRDRAFSPRAERALGMGDICVGFGGTPDPENATNAELAPPWLRCDYEASSRALTVTPDRLGFALVFYRRVGTSVAFSSSALALARLAPVLPRDDSAFSELLAFNHVLGTRTHRKGIELLPGGCSLRIAPEGLSTPVTFRFGDIALYRGAREISAAELADALRVSVQQSVFKTDAAEPLIVPLSGGLDSRLLAAAAARTDRSVTSFTFAREHSPGAAAIDARVAKQVAEELGIAWRFEPLASDWIAQRAHEVIRVSDGHLDVLHAMAINASTRFTEGGVLLDGIGGDVILGGFAHTDEMLQTKLRADQLDALWRLRARFDKAWTGLLRPAAHEELRASARQAFAASIDDAYGQLEEGDPRWADVWTLRNRTRRFINSGPQMCTTFARPAFPYLAPPFLDRVLSTHPKLRVNGRLQAAVVHAGFPAMAAIPWQKTGRPIPRPGVLGALLNRTRPRSFPPFQPFFDYDAAFRESVSLRTFLRDIVLDPSKGIARFGYFDLEAVDKLFVATEQNRERGTSRLASLASLVLMDDVYLNATKQQ